jgi:DnaA family protein
MHQLSLPLQLRPDADFAAFIAGPNTEAVAATKAWAEGSGDDFIYLFGAPGSGKSHLLQAACHRGVQIGRSVVYLPLKHEKLAPSVLDNLELWDLVALDDVQAVAGETDWERGLFDLYNRLRESERCLLVSADAPVSKLPLERADLRSRLGWGPGYRLLPLPEEECAQLLRSSARRRGLELAADAVEYIMRRCPREPGPLMEVLEEIDKESLRMRRRATLWLARQVLASRES